MSLKLTFQPVLLEKKKKTTKTGRNVDFKDILKTF